jgi:hypothetical protein
VSALPGESALERAFWPGFAACVALTLVLLAPASYWPLVDLPQHAAALSIFRHLDEPAWGFAAQFEVQWGTPYLLLYALAYPLEGLLGPVKALQAVALAGIAATPLALLPWTRWAGLPRALALLGFPLALGFSFWFGFLNFSLTLPLIFALTAAALRHLEAPTARGIALLALAMVGLFWAHGLAAAFVAPTVVLVALLSPGAAGRRLAGAAVVTPAAAMALFWGSRQGALVDGAGKSVLEGTWAPERLLELPALLLGVHQDDALAFTAGCLLLLLPLALGLRPSPEPRRWVPLGVSLALFLGFPMTMAGVSFLYQRFAIFVPPALWLALSGLPAPLFAPLRTPPLCAALALIWLLIAGLRVRAFDAEARSFDPILEAMEPRKAVRPVTFTSRSDALPGGLPYVHFAAYYQAYKGGRIGFSFARNYTSFIRYKHGVDPGMAQDDEWYPERFSFAREGGQYDYFLVRSAADASTRLFPPGAVSLVKQSEKFYLYRRIDPAPSE